jgi:aspartyl/asparaginyl beta-hydroxylase (cupin superfamily)
MADSPNAEDRTDTREGEADLAAARGDVATARRLLEEASASAPDRAELWLKLAAMCRAQRDIDAALGAVGGALRVDPLGFLPLLLKASLLDAAGRTGEAGEAYGHALAQRPAAIPAELEAAVGAAERRDAEHKAALSNRLAGAIAPMSARLAPREARRLARFRSNISRETRPFHCEPSHFHYPGLYEREFHDPEDFPWLAELEAATADIVADFHRVMASERAELVPYIQYPDDVPLRQWKALNRSRDWTAIHLVRNGQRIDANARHCPTVMALLDRLDQPQVGARMPNAMFSLLAPGAHIPPHHGVANIRLVCHLGLIIPAGCWFRVGDERREWREGEAWVFDDTIEHEAANPSESLRVVLIVDTWHPGLSPTERDAVRATMEASGLGGEAAAL